MKSPFFATLALFARFIPTQHTPTAATDGKDIFFNPNYLRSLPSAQQDGLLLHEVLHAALLHTVRRGVRDPKVWNIAADIVVNGMIVQQGVFDLPPGGVRDPKLEHLSVEEICELLLKQDSAQLSLPNPDLLDRSPNNALSKQNQGTSNPSNHEAETETQSQKSADKAQQLGDKLNLTDVSQDASRTQLESPQVTCIPASLDSLSQARKATLETHWKNALQQSMVIARTVNQGKLPAGLERELGVLTAAQIDWRSYLWRYLVRTPTDFMGFDRRFVGRGLYLESLVGESVRVFVAVDTSGSIDQRQLRLFLSEVQGILGTYPHLQCDLYYADAEIYGPYVLDPDVELPTPKGGGGTSFVPFFQQVAEQWDGMTMGVCIYLTDGYGQFPTEAPCLPVLWVVTSGGLALEQFPFGEAVRLLSR